MSEPERPSARERKLSRERILEAALRIADEEGLDALSMRRLGQALGVQAMSLYKHVAGKEDVLDGIADLVMLEVEVPARTLAWQAALRQAATSMHRALLRHPWASVVIESRRNPGPARLRYLDTVVSILLEAGFPIDDVGRAGLAVDSHVYGFTLQVVAMPFDLRDEPEEADRLANETFGDAYPGLRAMAEHAAQQEGFPIEFDFGLEMILEGLERHLAAARSGRAARAAGANPKRRTKG
jgi:AcrR family transcriptional regulator